MSADYRTVPLAVVGMACRFPGADDLDAFWRLLEEGRSGISELPPDRLDQRLYYDPDRNSKETSYSRIGGIVPTRPLNRDVCPVPDDVASQFDETHLAICEVACTAMRDAGYHSQRRPPENTGVYIGNCTGSNLEADLVYRSHAGELGALLCEVAAEDLNGDVLQAAATAFAESIRNSGPSWRDGPVREVTAAAAARLVSGTLDLRGPSLAVDAACVSSFVALHLAGMALHRGRIDAAIVGAFSYRNWWEMVLLSSTQTLGPDGSCPFSAAAGGMVPADGYAALIVKTLPRALKDGDRIHGVIRALGFSSDGRGKSFWAPRQEGQMAAVRRAYEHGIEPQFVQYVEAHGTSTQLGDATEMATLQESLGGAVRGPVPVGSVKANIGHTLEVAGLAGLIKTLLAMRHGVVPASIHCEPLSPGIDWANPAFRVPVEAEPWTTPVDGRPRRAGIDSFGIGGLNVHVVVDESPAGLEPARETANETAGDDLAVIGVAAPVAEAPLVRQLLDLTGHQRTAVTAADYVFDWKKHRIPPKEVANANPLQFLLLDAAVCALEHAGYGDRPFDRSRVGTVVGTHFTGDFACDALLGVRLPEIRETLAAALSRHDVPPEQIAGITAEFAETLLQRKPARHDVTGSLSSSTLSSRIAKHLDLMGGAMSIDAGLQSPAAALIAAADLLHSGTNDLVICAVGQDLTDVAFHEQLAAGRKPGFLPGTGAAAIVLKRVADARRDGDTIHSVLPADVARRLSSDAARRTPGSGERCNVQPASNNDVTSPSDTAPGYSGVLAVERETLERSIIEAVVEQTALPTELVGPRSHLRNDLGFDAAATRQLLREFRVPETTRCETVRQLVDAALDERAGSPIGRRRCEPDSEATALRRFVLRTVELPLDDAAATPAFAGPALILGDNPAATALAERLAGMDVPVIIVPAGDTRAALRELERICAERLPAHLFLMTGRDETGDERLPVSQLLLPVLVCRRWLKGIGNAKLFERASLVAVTMLGGDYGFLRSADSRRPLADGGVCGLLKSLHAESPSGLTVRIVDAPANEPPKMIAAAVCRELASNAGEIETASVRGKRNVIRAVPQSAGDLPRREVARDTHWIVTGGVATSLGRELERRLGITAHAIDSHLTDRRSLADRLTQIRSRGPIAGIICGPPAGELQRAAFPEQSEEAVERGLRERIEAAELLLELTAGDPLTHILVMGCCGRFGVALRTLESAVDDGLAKLTAGFANRHADCRAIFAHCPGITDDRTIAAVIDELQIDSRETEFLLAVPSGDGDPNYVVLPSAAECAAHDQLRPHVAAAPLIEECFAGPAGGIAEVLFDPAGDPFLTGHLDDGTPLLPAVAGIETCAQAASVWSKGRIVSALRDQQIPNGFRMARPGPHRARVLLSGSDEETTCRLVGDFYDKNGRLTDPFRLYQTCVIELADSPRDIPRPDFGPQPADDWADVPYPEDWRDMVAAESGTVFYGPQLRTLKSVRHRPDGSWGRMIAPPTGEIGGDRPGSRWHTPAALLDGALFLCDLHAVHNFGTRQLPQVIDRIDFGRLPEPGEECTARVLFRGRDGRRITWDFWVLGRDGSVILATHGFHVVTLR